VVALVGVGRERNTQRVSRDSLVVVEPVVGVERQRNPPTTHWWWWVGGRLLLLPLLLSMVGKFANWHTGF
jgi:hypothetical protein